MPSQPSDDLLLLIRCPSCGQRFKVGEDLRDKTVECGGCENRFRIDDEVIVRGRKFYPGERKDPGLNRFPRVPLSMAPSGMASQSVSYANAPDPAVLEPASPLRILAGGIGVAGMILMALLLMFGANRGGSLDGMPLFNRLVMAGFASLMGILFLLYANPRARGKALAVGLLLSAGVIAVPFLFNVGSQPGEPQQEAAFRPEIAAPTAQNLEDEKTQVLKNRIGTDPLDKENTRLQQDGSQKRAVGLWLRGLTDVNKIIVRDYIFRTTGADRSSSHSFPRDGGDSLMVVTGAKQTLEELVDVVSLLGKVENVYPNLSVIEIRVNNENFTEGPIDKLSQKDDPAFYDLNKRELESIDLERVKRAVQRLAEAEPKVYRSDISRKLISLLGEEDVNFKGNICRALTTWAEKNGPAGDAALKAVKELMRKQAVVEEEMIALIVKEKNPAVIPILDELWFKNPTTWESLFAEMGPPIEPAVIRRFPATEGPVRYSAVRLLGRVGGAESLPLLAAAGTGANPELRILLESAQKAVRERLARFSR